MRQAEFGRHHGPRSLAAEPCLKQCEAAFRDNAVDEKVLWHLAAEDLKGLGVVIVGHAARRHHQILPDS